MNQDASIHSQTLSTTESTQLKGSTLAWAIFFTGILYYCFAYLLRVYPSIMEPDLLSHFHITAGSFGILTSFYYFAYAPMQLPVGVSVDRIGPRRSLLFACCVCILGVFIFAYSDHYALALVGRFLVGLGAAFAYVTALKLATLWLPRRYFATATGAVTGSGMVAAILTDLYLTRMVRTTNFHHALYFPLIVGIILLVLIFLVVRDKPKNTRTGTEEKTEEAHALSYRQLFEYLLVIAKSPQMWIIGLVGALLYLPSSVFLDVWAIPYLERVFHLTPHNAAMGVSVMLVGWIFSSFATGALSDILGTRKMPLVIATFGAATVSAFILYFHAIPVPALFILLFMLGVFCGPHPLCFTLSKENHSQKISGTAIAFSNFVIMMGGFIFQPVVGKILDWNWGGLVEHGIRIYTPGNYIFALSIIPVGLVIAGILSLCIKETYHRAVDH